MTQALYHRPLKFESSLVADVLSALKTLDHLVYLNNNGQPFIACCAQEYFVAPTSQIQSFKRTGIEQYQPTPSEFNLAIDALKNLQKNGFHGGYVGFVGYDYAAQQYIQYPDRSQPGLFIGQFSSYIKPSSEGWMFYSDDPEAEQIFDYIQNLLNQNKEPATWNVFTKTYLSDVIANASAKPNSFIENCINQTGSHDIKALGIPFDYSKPKTLIQYLMEVARIENNDIILDFFAGSSTTAHAILDTNAKDSKTMKFIMVQIPEVLEPDTAAHKAAYKFCVDAGLQPSISEISKERIRRAGKKVIEDNKDKEGIEDLDIGFRVLKIDSTNMKEVYYTPDEYSQAQLDNLESHIKEDFI